VGPTQARRVHVNAAQYARAWAACAAASVARHHPARPPTRVRCSPHKAAEEALTPITAVSPRHAGLRTHGAARETCCVPASVASCCHRVPGGARRRLGALLSNPAPSAVRAPPGPFFWATTLMYWLNAAFGQPTGLAGGPNLGAGRGSKPWGLLGSKTAVCPVRRTGCANWGAFFPATRWWEGSRGLPGVFWLNPRSARS
jgi:hypothetical protein